MGDVYDMSEGAYLHISDRHHGSAGPGILLDTSDQGRAAVEAVRALLARQISEQIAYLNAQWGEVDPQLISFVESEFATDLAEYAQATADALTTLATLAPIVDDEDEDDDGDPEPAPDPEGSTHA